MDHPSHLARNNKKRVREFAPAMAKPLAELQKTEDFEEAAKIRGLVRNG